VSSVRSTPEKRHLQPAFLSEPRCRRFYALIGAIAAIAAGFVCSPHLQAQTTSEDAEKGQHDMLLLLPDGPIHLRVNLSDAGRSLKQTRGEYLQKLIKTLDTDSDGEVSRAETSKHPLFVGGRRFENNKFLNKLRSRRPLAEDEIALAVDRAAGQFITFRQNNALAEQDLSVFRVLDADESGLIDRVEMRLAPARVSERDGDFDQCITFDEFLNDQPQTMPDMLPQINDEPPASVYSELLRDAREPIMAARLVRIYDENRDAHLSTDELGWSRKRTAVLDKNRDSRLSMQELGGLAESEPDLTLNIDLARDASEAMQLVSPETPEIVAARSDVIRFKRDGLSLSIGYRHRDPMEEAEQNASATFNVLDVDANGYLDRDEIADHHRFQRYLFDAMDRDEDDRVFAEEMMTYVKDYTEPASTTCQVTLLDTGNGFFQLLDGNADGRISIRELRKAEQTLLSVADKRQRINPSRLQKSYRIEFQRGGIGLFGRVDRPSAETPAALLKPPSGPIWFQRMDRNGDGDLTWDEFLGPRDVFHEIDEDRDGLIDENEAKKASNTAS
jgi:Ca2+-binding EF-hand superfamily protein